MSDIGTQLLACPTSLGKLTSKTRDITGQSRQHLDKFLTLRKDLHILYHHFHMFILRKLGKITIINALRKSKMFEILLDKESRHSGWLLSKIQKQFPQKKKVVVRLQCIWTMYLTMALPPCLKTSRNCLTWWQWHSIQLMINSAIKPLITSKPYLQEIFASFKPHYFN